MALSTILRLLMKAGQVKKAAKVGKAMSKSLPKKSKDMPGVKTAKSKPRKEFDADKAWEQQMDEFYGYGPHPTMTQANLVMRRPAEDILRKVKRMEGYKMPRKAPSLSPEVMRMIERLKVGERLPARTFKSAAERYAPLRGKKKPTVWDQMRAMADEFDDYPID